MSRGARASRHVSGAVSSMQVLLDDVVDLFTGPVLKQYIFYICIFINMTIVCYMPTILDPIFPIPLHVSCFVVCRSNNWTTYIGFTSV